MRVCKNYRLIRHFKITMNQKESMSQYLILSIKSIYKTGKYRNKILIIKSLPF